ncbi:stage II sporulation protein D [Bacillus sp. CGMCC 1.16607]|uniref:stage II sporulation protein D n=1 Tax=Bacillus sp. CGMCC 1.16607 TaxID=3351842 RepID=UPI003636B09C
MKNIKPFVVLTAILFTITLLIPALLVLPFSDKASGKLGEGLSSQRHKAVTVDASQLDSAIEVAVYRMSKKHIENLPLERYVVGVVAAEMPADFELEALKAQALTARTYIVKQMMSAEKIGVPEGADVTDSVNHQVFRDDEELKQDWKLDYSWKLKKIQEAVLATKGQILTYEGSPIFTTFFSTSNGYTENSEDYWQNAFPYLRSVKSPWDVEESPKFTDQVVMTIADFEQKLGVKLNGSEQIGQIIEKTEGNRVAKVKFDGKTLSGRDIRDKLDLKSSDFSWVRKGNHIVINTKGYGHGVGMSQYGANGMAKEGKNYEQIVKYYYQGVNIQTADQHLNTITAKK